MALYAALLLLTLIIGLWRVLRGPGRVDRLLVVQLFGTSGTALLLVLAQWQGAPALRDAALVLALLAAMVSAALVQLLRLVESRDTSQAAQRTVTEYHVRHILVRINDRQDEAAAKAPSLETVLVVQATGADVPALGARLRTPGGRTRCTRDMLVERGRPSSGAWS